MSIPDPILVYALDSVSNLGTDLSGNGYDATASNVTIVSDATYGDVANFSGAGNIQVNSPPSALTGTGSRTISMWVNMDSNGDNEAIYTQGNASGTGSSFRITIGRSSNEIRFENQGGMNYTQSLSNGVWYHVAFTYSSPISTAYFQGGVLGTLSGTYSPINTTVSLGKNFGNGFQYEGQMLDFRVYDSALSSTQINTLYTTGPENGSPLQSITPTVYPYAINLEWTPIVGASTYSIRIKKDSDEYYTIADNLTDVMFTINDIDDGASYDIELYTDLDSVNPILTSENNITPNIDSAGAGQMLSLLSNDLSTLSSSNVSEMESFIHGNLATDDGLIARIIFNDKILPATAIKYVAGGGTTTLEDNQSPILTPFDPNGGGSQSIDMILSDTTVSTMTYNETTGVVTIDGNDYNVGDKFILDRKEVKISELN